MAAWRRDTGRSGDTPEGSAAALPTIEDRSWMRYTDDDDETAEEPPVKVGRVRLAKVRQVRGPNRRPTL